MKTSTCSCCNPASKTNQTRLERHHNSLHHSYNLYHFVIIHTTKLCTMIMHISLNYFILSNYLATQLILHIVIVMLIPQPYSAYKRICHNSHPNMLHTLLRYPHLFALYLPFTRALSCSISTT